MSSTATTTNAVYYAPFMAPKTFKCLGILIAISAIITFILGIIDVAVTYEVYSIGGGSSGCNINGVLSSAAICQPGNLVYTWIGVGIWASVPKKWFTMLAFVSAIIFAPVMVIVSAIEAAMANHVYYNNPPYNDYEKLIIPVCIACIGFLEFIMTAILMIRMCFCTEDPIAKNSAMTIPWRANYTATTSNSTSASTCTPVAVSTTTPTINPIIVQTSTPSSNPVQISYQAPSNTSALAITPCDQSNTGYNYCNNLPVYGNTTNWTPAVYSPNNVGWSGFSTDKTSNFITLAGPSACSTNLPVAYAGAYKFFAK
jgi:hypothetical protein